MQLSPDRFNRFLNKMGQGVEWRRAIDCPCRNPHSGGANPSCPVCRGTGQSWDEPLSGTVALTGQQIQRQWANFGLWEKGDVVVSLPGDSLLYAMGEFDRVRFMDSSEPFSRVLVRGRETLHMIAVVSLDRAVALNGGTLVELPVPVLDEHGLPDWPDFDGPPPGVTYTLAGRAYPEYFCYGDFPQDRAHHHGEPLPRKVVLRKFDLFGRTQ